MNHHYDYNDAYTYTTRAFDFFKPTCFEWCSAKMETKTRARRPARKPKFRKFAYIANGVSC